MATAIFDFDIEQIPPTIEVHNGYDRALILGRFNGTPVARIFVPVSDRHIRGEIVRDKLLEAAGERYWNLWLRRYLDLHDNCDPVPSATIAICTRERPTDLRRCLESLIKLPRDWHEILVIDNCPASDATRNVVAEFPSVRYVCELNRGLNNARNRALLESEREIIAFIDDDAVADERWLKSLLKNFNDPLVACVTGLTMPLELETDAQEWFEKHCPFCKGFERRTFRGDEHSPVQTGEIGAGVNMALRRETILSLGAFDPLLDAGTPTESGGDHEMFSRVLASGYSIVYEPEALNWHRHRRTWPELQKVLYGYGVGVYALLTRTLLVEKEPAALKIAWGWFRYDQFPALMRTMAGRIDRKRLDLLRSELRGCLSGPFAYFRSKRMHLATHKL